MTSVLLQAIYGVGWGGIGFFAGLSLSWRRYRLAGRDVTAPALAHSDRQQAFALIAVTLLAVMSAVYAAMQQVRQSDCNADFRQSLIDRSAIATESQRHLDAMLITVGGAISSPDPAARDKARQAIVDYAVWAAEAERQRSQHPIADPKCKG